MIRVPASIRTNGVWPNGDVRFSRKRPSCAGFRAVFARFSGFWGYGSPKHLPADPAGKGFPKHLPAVPAGKGSPRFMVQLALVVSILLGILIGAGQAEPLASRSRTLTILYTNDTHSHLKAFDLPDVGKDVGGLGRREAYFQRVRKENPATLVLDGGDIFQGTSFFSFFKGEVDVKGFSLLGYDATVLGNHDIDEGLENTLKLFREASFPMLCSNVRYSGSKEPVFEGFRIVNREGFRAGLIGVIGKDAWSVIPLNRRSGIEFTDEFESVASLAATLRAQTDVVILLSHLGYEGDLEMAAKVPNLDVIIGGHTNTYLETPVLVKHESRLVAHSGKSGLGGTVIVQGFKMGVFVGRLDLQFDPSGNIATYSGSLQILDKSIPVLPNSPVERLVGVYEERIRAQTSQIIGMNPEELPYPEGQKHVRDLPLGTFVCETMREFVRADLAIINSGGIRASLKSGEITMGDIFDLCPFENTVTVVNLSGAAIRGMLEFICQRYSTITGYQYAGVSCVFDLRARVVRDIFVGGSPLDPKKEYRLATISYLTDGNQNGKDLFKEARSVSETGFLMRDAILEYLRVHRTVSVPEGKRINFVPEPEELGLGDRSPPGPEKTSVPEKSSGREKGFGAGAVSDAPRDVDPATGTPQKPGSR